MSTRLQIFILIGSLITIVTIVNMVRKEKLDLKYSLTWIIINTFVLIACIFPKLIEVGAALLGVAIPMNAVFFVGILAQLIISFSLTVAQSRNSNKLKEMAQKIALLEVEMVRKNETEEKEH